MATQLAGRVFFANGIPAPGVRVRIFDRDAEGKTDDDLTISPGLSDASGNFTVEYDPSRASDIISITTTEPRGLLDWTLVQRTRTFADPLDRYLPYLEFRYTRNNQERVETIDLGMATDFYLAEPPPVATLFRPASHGFKFINFFAGYPLPFTIPSLPVIPKVDSSYGLCGGMAAAAADYFFAAKPIPAARNVPSRNSRLHQYLFRRQIDSFSPFGQPVTRFAQWMGLMLDTPSGTYQRSLAEFEQLRERFAAGITAVPVGLVFAWPSEPLWKNHQVLAYGYSEPNPNRIEIAIYDPNYPENDQVFIRAERVPLQPAAGANPDHPTGAGLRCSRVALVSDGQGGAKEDTQEMRGFFLMPYQPVAPPGL